jgi:hypothetical protein
MFENYLDWTISSQAPKETANFYGEGSTTIPSNLIRHNGSTLKRVEARDIPK